MVSEHFDWFVNRRVQAALLDGKYRKAERIATFYTRLRPNNPEAWLIHHRVHTTRRDYKRAEEIVQQGLSRVPESPTLLDALVDLLMKRRAQGDRDMERGRDLILQLIHNHPNSPYSLVARVRLAEDDRNIEEMRRLVREADRDWDLSTEDQHFCFLRLSTLLLSLPEERQTARRLFEKAANTKWSNPIPHMVLAVLTEKDGDMRLAREYRTKGLRGWPGSKRSFDRRMKEMQAWLDSL
jgi:Tfp pilus assembly protein PilF